MHSTSDVAPLEIEPPSSAVVVVLSSLLVLLLLPHADSKAKIAIVENSLAEISRD
jgi:hypothetical protein